MILLSALITAKGWFLIIAVVILWVVIPNIIIAKELEGGQKSTLKDYDEIVFSFERIGNDEDKSESEDTPSTTNGYPDAIYSCAGESNIPVESYIAGETNVSGDDEVRSH